MSEIPTFSPQGAWPKRRGHPTRLQPTLATIRQSSLKARREQGIIARCRQELTFQDTPRESKLFVGELKKKYKRVEKGLSPG